MQNLLHPKFLNARKLSPKNSMIGRKKMSNIGECQDAISDYFTSEALINFRREMRNCYHEDVWLDTFTAVGPMDTFLGWLVKTRRMIIQEPRKLTWKERITGRIGK
jgi:hypothetical protein